MFLPSIRHPSPLANEIFKTQRLAIQTARVMGRPTAKYLPIGVAEFMGVRNVIVEV